MTLEQLRIFITVAETLNMRRASELLHLTQPAVSAAVRALEARHGTRLLDRVGRGLELNAAGRTFLPEARGVLARAEDARRVLDDLAGLARGEVRVAASQTVATYWLPAGLARFAARYPGVDITMAVGNTAQAIAAVLAGEADIAFVEGAVDHDLLHVDRMGGDRLGLYAALDHPLVGALIEPDVLRTASWVLREPGSGTREHFAASLADIGIAISDLSVRLTLPSNGAVLEAVAAGNMIGAVSDLAAASRVAAGTVARLGCTFPTRDFKRAVHRARRLSRATAAFVDEIAAA
jgi:DNA-binding transcriptional LysR family regulator